MNAIFHAGAGVALGALALGPEATPADLALCAAAGTSPDWDGLLLLSGRPLYSRFHRAATHGLVGLAAGALLAGGILSLWGGWSFGRAAGLWLLAAAGHTASDLFNRSGVVLLHPFSSERTRFPAVSWASPLLTLGACATALGAYLASGGTRLVAVAGVAGYAVHLRRRLREPVLQDALSRWWFERMCGGPFHPYGEAPLEAAPGVSAESWRERA